jgi:hypothetical protein
MDTIIKATTGDTNYPLAVSEGGEMVNSPRKAIINRLEYKANKARAAGRSYSHRIYSFKLL